MKRLGIFTSHPIPYHILVYRELARRIDLKVFFYSRFGVEKYFDPQFKKEISWDIPLLDGYQYVFLKNRSPGKNFSFWDFINFDILKVLKQEKFDAVLLNSWSYASDWIALFFCLFLRIPVLFRVENAYIHELQKPKWKIYLKKIVLGKFIFSFVNTFLYIGEQNRKFLRYYEVPERKLFPALYCIENDRFANAYDRLCSKRRELRDKWDIPQDAVVIFSGGTKLSRKKRSMDLIRAFADLPTDPKAVLVLIGEGELKEEARAYIKERKIRNIVFTGFVNYSEMPELYIASDILVLPSGAGETWGVVVNEAMCCRLPVIVSDLVGSGEDLVHNGENGFVFKCGDITELTKNIQALVGDDNMRRRFGEKSFEIVKKYSCSAVAEAIEKAL